MKSLAGKLFFAVILLAVLGDNLSRQWDGYVLDNPGATTWAFTVSLLPMLGGVLFGIAVIAGADVLARNFGAGRWFATAQNPPPPPDAGPLYALRTYPVHVGICLGLIVSSVLLYFFWLTAAMVSVGLTIGAWVLLGRRLGFEPADDSVTTDNPMRT